MSQRHRLDQSRPNPHECDRATPGPLDHDAGGRPSRDAAGQMSDKVGGAGPRAYTTPGARSTSDGGAAIGPRRQNQNIPLYVGHVPGHVTCVSLKFHELRLKATAPNQVCAGAELRLLRQRSRQRRRRRWRERLGGRSGSVVKAVRAESTVPVGRPARAVGPDRQARPRAGGSADRAGEQGRRGGTCGASDLVCDDFGRDSRAGAASHGGGGVTVDPTLGHNSAAPLRSEQSAFPPPPHKHAPGTIPATRTSIPRLGELLQTTSQIAGDVAYIVGATEDKQRNRRCGSARQHVLHAPIACRFERIGSGAEFTSLERDITGGNLTTPGCRVQAGRGNEMRTLQGVDHEFRLAREQEYALHVTDSAAGETAGSDLHTREVGGQTSVDRS